jgi:hypothetical protein
MLILILNFFAIANTQFHADDSQEPVRIRIPLFELYKPGKIVISYAYTKNVTTQVSTLKTSLYTCQYTPMQIEFEGKDTDLYTVVANVTYDMKVTQTIIISFFEAGRPAKSIQFDTASTGFTITFTLSIVDAPHFPTAEEIGQVMWSQWRSELGRFENSQQDLVNAIMGTATVTGGLAAIAFALSIALLIITFRIMRKQAQIEAHLGG